MAKKIVDSVVVRGETYTIAATDSNLADIEIDATKASKAYEVGEHLLLDGQYYVVTTAIAKDDPITVGTNVEAQSVGEEIADLKSSFSHIGMIVQSTTLDTEAKVIAIYGGTSWSKIEGRVLVGEGTLDSTHSYTINMTGGEPEHTLTTDEMPSHQHGIPFNTPHAYRTNAQAGSSANLTELYGSSSVSATGGSQPHNIMQPYKVVYIWERTA